MSDAYHTRPIPLPLVRIVWASEGGWYVISGKQLALR
jgi:hypothetical protein